MSGFAPVPALGAWRPLSINEARRAFEAMPASWWVAGGLAIDLFIRHETRAHADIDIAVPRSEHKALSALQEEFELFVADSGVVRRWHGQTLEASEHQFWARRRNDDAWAFEVLIEEGSGGMWRYRRDERIALPFTAFGTRTGDGVPYVRPEIALLYKSNWITLERNALDFAAAAPLLDAPARQWLSEALDVTAPGHPWVAALT